MTQWTTNKNKKSPSLSNLDYSIFKKTNLTYILLFNIQLETPLSSVGRHGNLARQVNLIHSIFWVLVSGLSLIQDSIDIVVLHYISFLQSGDGYSSLFLDLGPNFSSVPQFLSDSNFQAISGSDKITENVGISSGWEVIRVCWTSIRLAWLAFAPRSSARYRCFTSSISAWG